MGFSLRNSRLASVGLASIIAVGVIGVGGVAMAQEGGSSDSSEHPPKDGHKVGKLGAAGLLKDSGVTKEELKEGAAAGLTLGQIIDQYGDISAAEAKANALAALGVRLDEAVAGGKLKQEQADKIEAAAPAMIDRILAAVPGEHRGDEPHPGKPHPVAKNALETVADVLGTDVATLTKELASGKTIAEVAGPQTQAVIDALVADANAAIDKAAADGRIPADKVDGAKEKAAAAIEKLVNEGRPHKPAGVPHGGPGARRGPANSQ